MSYEPPFTITTVILNRVAEISELVGRHIAPMEQSMDLRLRRINQIKTICGSLAIEGNTLNESQITAILEGKPVIAPAREVQEAKNALAVYDQVESFQPCSEDDLLRAHYTLMLGLIDELGTYRRSGVGVMSGETVVHMAPPAERVSGLMADLFQWLERTEVHPLIASSVFHYEFEFIHPFADGNGRMGRLWQSLILADWQTLFYYLPVESMVHQHQDKYYRAIQQSTQQADSAPFIEFMLGMILEAVRDINALTPQVAPQVAPQVKRLVKLLLNEKSRDELQGELGLKDRKSFQSLYLKPALEAGLVEMTIPDKPSSRNQAYRLTLLGLKLQQELAVSS